MYRHSSKEVSRYRAFKYANLDYIIKIYAGIVDIFEGTGFALDSQHAICRLVERLRKVHAEPQLFEAMMRVANETAKVSLQGKTYEEPLRLDIVFDVEDNDTVQKSFDDIARRQKQLKITNQANPTCDAFGVVGDIAEEPFGLVHNKFPLFQKDGDVRSYASYGLNSVDSFPLASSTRNDIHEIA